MCPVCLKQFSAKSVLDIHMAIHDSGTSPNKEPNKAYACSVCYKRFTTKTRLDSHLLIQHDSGSSGGYRHVATTEEDTKSNVRVILEAAELTGAIKEEGGVGKDDEDGQDEESLEDFQIRIKVEPDIDLDALNQTDEM